MGDYLLIPSAILVYFLIKYYCFAINHDSEHFEYIFLNDGYDNEINNELDNENTEIVPPKYESIVEDLPSYSENSENNSENSENNSENSENNSENSENNSENSEK
jgi:hypothetical protein